VVGAPWRNARILPPRCACTYRPAADTYARCRNDRPTFSGTLVMVYPATLSRSELPLPLVHRGKVRDIFAVDDDRILIVATDRVSAYDVVMAEPIAGKGIVLTQLSAFWFERTQHIVPNHLLSVQVREALPALVGEHPELDGRTMLV